MVFTSTPDGVGMKLASGILASGAKLIDYSGDFRFNTVDSYAEYARRIGRETVQYVANIAKYYVAYSRAQALRAAKAPEAAG